MMKEIQGLPSGVIGVEVQEKVSKADYEETLLPLLEQVYKKGERIRFVYRLAPDVKDFALPVGLGEFRLGWRLLRLFERCAIISDHEWVKNGTRLAAMLMPCPVQVFANTAYAQALSWVAAPARADNVTVELLEEQGIAVLEPKGRLGAEDFDHIASVLDPWIERHYALHGLVVHARKFPGWEDAGSFFRHVQFIRQHHRNVERIAVAGDGVAIDWLPKIAAQFVNAEVKTFAYDQLDAAKTWAAARQQS